MSDLEAMATEAREYFEVAERKNACRKCGDVDEARVTTFWRMKDTAPEWVHALCRAAHDDCKILPDDYRYAFTVSALDYLSEGNDPDEYNPEPDCYNTSLLSWLRESCSGPAYCDEAREEYGEPGDGGIMRLVALGQVREMDEVYQATRSFLESRVSEAATR